MEIAIVDAIKTVVDDGVFVYLLVAVLYCTMEISVYRWYDGN